MSPAEILKENKEVILTNWLDRVRQEMPITREYRQTAIENGLSDLFDAIGLKLESEEVNELKTSSRIHGNQRTLLKKYSLRHVIEEYNLLRAEILKVFDSKNITKPKYRDDVIIVFDNAIKETAESFYISKQNVSIKARKAAEKKADQLHLENQHREEFIHTITHDLNSPLNNIKGCIYLLEMDSDLDNVSKTLSILKTSASQADSLINDFLDVGKVNQSDKFPLVRSNFDIIEELENQIEIFRISQGKEIEFESKVNSIDVNIDLDLLRRSFANLINNALQYGEEESSIRVACDEDKGTVIVSVQNFGKIIPKDQIKNIFNKYYQGNGDNKGWGIGLAFVQEVLKAHGGETSVESNKEAGTTFKLIFPKTNTPNKKSVLS